MSDNTEDRYDVIVYENATKTVVSIIGKNMPLWDGVGTGRNTADLRLQTGWERVDPLRFTCEIVKSDKYKVGDVFE